MRHFEHLLKRAATTLGVVLLACAVVWLDPVRGTQQQAVDIWFFDIGQGDSALIQSGKTQILIDGGPNTSLTGKLGRVMPFWDHTIEYTFVSHPHEDHFVGLLPLKNHYNLLQTFAAPQVYASQSWQVFTDRYRPAIAAAGDEFELAPNIHAQVLAPAHRNPQQYEDPNDGSLIILFTIYDKKILFTGDAGVEQEKAILDVIGDIDVLKAGHHGSYTSTSRELLESSTPEYAIISCGLENSYGHPHESTLNRLKEFGVDTWRTDLEGDIRLRISPPGYTVESYELIH